MCEYTRNMKVYDFTVMESRGVREQGNAAEHQRHYVKLKIVI